MSEIFMVTYKDCNNSEHDSIEGYVHNRDQFLEWLRNRNIERIKEGEISEYPDEFELTLLEELQ